MIAEVGDEDAPVTVKLHANFASVTFDHQMCASGGSVQVHYTLHTDQVLEGGYLDARFQGCGHVEVFTR